MIWQLLTKSLKAPGNSIKHLVLSTRSIRDNLSQISPVVLQLPWVATHLPVKERCGQEPAVPERRGQTPPSGTRTGEAALLGSGSHGMDGQMDEWMSSP